MTQGGQLLALLAAMPGVFRRRGRQLGTILRNPVLLAAPVGGLLLALAIPRALADAPSRLLRTTWCAPRTDTAWPEPQIAAARVTIGGRAPGGEAVSWSVPGWHRVLLVGDDCRVLGVGYPGENLLAPDDRW